MLLPLPDIWLLGVCFKLDAIGGDPVSSSGFAAFVEDFSSRILMTYRKGYMFFAFVCCNL